MIYEYAVQLCRERGHFCHRNVPGTIQSGRTEVMTAAGVHYTALLDAVLNSVDVPSGVKKT